MTRNADLHTSTEDNNQLRADVAARQAIEKNNDDLLAVPRNALDNDTARNTAREDVANLIGIKNEAERFFAALAIGDTAEKQAAYKTELQTANPDIAKETETLRAVITDNERQFERENRQNGAFSGINAQTRQPELFPYVEPHETRNILEMPKSDKALVAEAVAGAMIDAKVSDPAQREALKAAVSTRMSERERAGKVPTIPIYDKSATIQTHQHERTGPVVERNTERTH